MAGRAVRVAVVVAVTGRSRARTVPAERRPVQVGERAFPSAQARMMFAGRTCERGAVADDARAARGGRRAHPMTTATSASSATAVASLAVAWSSTLRAGRHRRQPRAPRARSLPDGVRGSALATAMRLGTLKVASSRRAVAAQLLLADRRAQHDERLHGLPPVARPRRRTRPPRRTAGWASSTASTSAGATFSPPVMIVSDLRPITRSAPVGRRARRGRRSRAPARRPG